jgi:hypothetical protein
MTKTNSSLQNVVFFNYIEIMDNVQKVRYFNKTPTSQTFIFYLHNI